MTSLAPSERLPFRNLPAFLWLLVCLLFWSASCAMAESPTSGSGSVLLTQEEQSWLADHPVIRLAPDPDFPPIEFIDEAGHPNGPSSTSGDQVAALPENLIASLNTLITSHLGRAPLPIHAAAEIAGVSVRTLQRWLGTTGSSYSRLVEQARYREAARLFSTPNARVTDTAYELGYSDVAHFSRAFKRMAGVSPSEYRRGWMN